MQPSESSSIFWGPQSYARGKCYWIHPRLGFCILRTSARRTSETQARQVGSPDVGLRSHDKETVSPDSARDELNLAPACRCVPFVKAWGAPPLPLPCREVALPPSPQCSQFLPASGPLFVSGKSAGITSEVAEPTALVQGPARE